MQVLPYHHDWPLAYQFTAGLRVHWFGRYAGTPDWRVETSRLAADMMSFFYVEKGVCWVIVNGRRLVLKRGDLLVIRGGDEFEFGHDPARPHVSLSVCLALERGGMANALLSRKFRRRYAFPAPGAYVAQFEKVLIELADNSPFRDLKIGGALLCWLALVMNHLQPEVDRGFIAARGVVDKVLLAQAWASARAKHVILLREWAQAVGLNEVYFGRVFKRETGLRPMEWLNQRRMQLASQQLAASRRAIAEIAEHCGFSSPFYFARVFTRHFGISPSAYRKRQV